MGGALNVFYSLIESGDRDGLGKYGHRCCAILDRNLRKFDIPMLTIGVVQGSALGGGFEALLSFDYVIAEKSAVFALPETMFGLFPGMGAHAFLTRKLGAAQADRMIFSGDKFSAEELFDLGIVHVVCEDGQGIVAAQAFMKKNLRRHAGLVGARAAARQVNPITLDELNRITEQWADTALELSISDLAFMRKLVEAQDRKASRV